MSKVRWCQTCRRYTRSADMESFMWELALTGTMHAYRMSPFQMTKSRCGKATKRRKSEGGPW